mgnify:CR=1 FL=1
MQESWQLAMALGRWLPGLDPADHEDDEAKIKAKVKTLRFHRGD